MKIEELVEAESFFTGIINTNHQNDKWFVEHSHRASRSKHYNL